MLETNDYEVITSCLNGRTNDFEKLVERYQKVIFNSVYRIVNDFDDAEDITQTVFIKAFENLENFKPEYKFFSWIYRIMINQTINWKKRGSQFSELNDNMVSPIKTPEEKYYSDSLSEKIQDSVAELEIDSRVVIVLKHFVSLPYRDISYILDLPEKTVKSRLFTARQLLSKQLTKNGIKLYD